MIPGNCQTTTAETVFTFMGVAFFGKRSTVYDEGVNANVGGGFEPHSLKGQSETGQRICHHYRGH